MAETDTKASRGAKSRGNEDVRSVFADVHRGYAIALQNAHLQAQRPYIDAYTGYIQAVGSAKPEEPLNTVYAYHDYVKNVMEASQSGDVCKPYEDAYRDYVRALKDAWSKLDADSLDPASLGVVIETMRAGAAAAQSSVRS